MTLAEQQVLFEQAKARIQRSLDEIAALSRSQIAPKDFLQRFVDLVVSSLDAMGASVWWAEAGELQRVAACRFETCGYDEGTRQRAWIEEVLKRTLAANRPHIVAAEESSELKKEVPGGEISNSLPYPFFYQPLSAGDRAGGVLQVWLKQAGDPRGYNDIAAFIGQLASHAETFLRSHQGLILAAKNQQAQVMLRMQSELVGELQPKVLLSVAANYLVDLASCDLACVFKKQGNSWSLVAASNQETVDARAAQALALAGVAGLLHVGNAGQIDASKADGDLKEKMEEAGLTRMAWKHFSSSKRAGPDLLLLACKNSPEPLAADACGMLTWAADQLTKALDAATHFHHLPLRPLVSSAGRLRRAWSQNRRAKVMMWCIPVFLAVVALWIPIPWKISANCLVIPERKAFVVAETSGKVVSLQAKEGEIVAAGQLIGKVDETDYLTQIAVAKQQLLRWQVEAGKAQSLGNEAERKIAEIGVAKESETLKRLDYLRSRTDLRSPIDGMILTRNLHNKLGEAIEPGKVFCEVGGLGQNLLQLDIQQKDLGDLLGALQSGQELPVEFILHPHPLTTLQTQLKGPASISQLPELREKGSVFLATAPFPVNHSLGDSLKPGFTGKAKILMGSRPMGWIFFRPFLNYLRMSWGL